MALEPLPRIPSDIEISQAATLSPIGGIAEKAGILPGELEPYGHTKAKISLSLLDRLKDNPDGKLILVTAMTATRAGEGKTVTSIGLAQAFGELGVDHMLCLREPSLGPTFGIKGGAAGGGYAQVLPMEDINMHFTGDLHAITAAHNLLAAVIDNHIHYDNELQIDPDRVIWRRSIDLCDRQLRNCEIGLGSGFDGFPHRSGFDITAASEVMAVLALSHDANDLRARLERMVVAYNTSGKPVFARDLNCIGAMCVLLKDALKPNLVQTIEQTPSLIHCGPFANIAHGCNSVLATRLGLKMAEYVVTEAGFAADLGAEKFLNIKCRQAGLKPAAVVLVVTCRALKMHGGVEMEEINNESVDAVVAGFENARVHAENLAKFGMKVVVAINRFPSDTEAEIDAVAKTCEEMGVVSAVSDVAALGGKGGTEMARKVLDLIENDPSDYHPLYDEKEPIKTKIETLAREIYRADGVDYTEQAEEMIGQLEQDGFDQLPLCVAKTQLSISDDAKKLGAPSGYRLKVKDLKLSNGAGFIVVVTGKILLMPGMPRIPTVEKI
ncbi:MAG: formate--tetrahydrofolate ligase, partial [Verrucomicrobiota bacterium]